MNRPLRLVLCAGEASGDMLGASLARALKARCPDIELAGIAGPAMSEAGVNAWHGVDELGVMGLGEVLSHLPRIYRLRQTLAAEALDHGADGFVGIDAPDFTIGLARHLKRRGMTTFQYVSPSVWAWRGYRVRRIARSLDMLLTLFPFEPALYQAHQLDARFVGHPLADELGAAMADPTSPLHDRQAAQAALGLSGSGPVIGLLPGSRLGEIERHAGILIEAAAILRKRHETAELVMLLAREDDRQTVESLIGPGLKENGVRLVCAQTRIGLRACQAAIAASGTVTLEAFLMECPLVVYYRLAPSTYWLARSLRLVRTRHVSLPNILEGRGLIPELLQHAATGQALADQAMRWIDTPSRREDYLHAARSCRERLALGAADRAAAAILERLGHAQDRRG